MNEPNDTRLRPPASQDKGDSVRKSPPLAGGFDILRNWWAHCRIGRLVLTGVLVLIGAMIVVPPTLSYNGFCFSQRRLLSNEEYVNIAISQIMSLRCYQLVSIGKCVPPIPYKDVADFRLRNPDCCKFIQHNSDFEAGRVTFAQQLFGNAAKSVLVNFKITYMDADGHSQTTIGHGLNVIGNCGNILNTGY